VLRQGNVHEHTKRHKRMPEPMAQRLFLQLLDAVAHCHAMKVCHRDLKLENFVLDKNQASGCNHRRTRLQPHGARARNHMAARACNPRCVRAGSHTRTQPAAVH
jgi:serine/threonine protein kinase